MPPDQPDPPPPEGEDGPRGRDADRRGRESPDPPHAGGDADAGSPGEAELPGPEEDLSAILGRWRVGRRHATVRMIRTVAGARAIQVRLPLGILQMGLGGRPDGRRPHGADSLLDWHLGRLEAHRAEGGDDGSFVLSSRECSSLRDEGVQVYHRYVALFALEEHELVVRDAERNLPRLTKDFFVSFDLDVLDASHAPGVSAMNPAGWSTAAATRMLLALAQSPRLRCIDFMELCPAHDPEGRTARVAAHMLLTTLRGLHFRFMALDTPSKSRGEKDRS